MSITNTGIILTLAYPDTIVKISDEKLAPYLRFINVGTKDYLRAGHAALVLIKKSTGSLEYFDFGRYTCPEGYGRVRGKETDSELDFPISANIEQENIKNLNEIIKFLATHPKLTHGDGKLVVSVCKAVSYKTARDFILKMQQQDFIRYGALIKKGSNCSRFVTDTLIASITDKKIKQQLIKSTRFTPSTVGNVVIADTEKDVFEVSETGKISKFNSTAKAENTRCFLDKLINYKPNLVGNIKPKPVEGIHEKAQWLGGIGAGAWFELFNTSNKNIYKYRRISPYGHVDVDDHYVINNTSFDYNKAYEFVHYSNCNFFHVKQKETIFRFERKLKN